MQCGVEVWVCSVVLGVICVVLCLAVNISWLQAAHISITTLVICIELIALPAQPHSNIEYLVHECSLWSLLYLSPGDLQPLLEFTLICSHLTSAVTFQSLCPWTGVIYILI